MRAHPSRLQAADHTGSAGSGRPSGVVRPSAGSTIREISLRVRVSSTVVPRPHVTATMLRSGLTDTDEPNMGRATEGSLPAGQWCGGPGGCSAATGASRS